MAVVRDAGTRESAFAARVPRGRGRATPRRGPPPRRGAPIQGDWKLRPDTCYAIEGNVTVPLAEWGGQPVQIKLEQDGWFDGERVHYIGGRQTEWHVIR